MRTITKTVLALGFVGAMAVGAAGSGMAQVYYSGPGVQVYVDPGYGHRYKRHRYYRHHNYRSHYGYAPRRGAKASNG
jgi:hypothetical protein